MSSWYSPPYVPLGSTAAGRPPDSQAASADQFSPSAPAADAGRCRVPVRTTRLTGRWTSSSPALRGFCRTPLTVRTAYVTRRTPLRPARSTTSAPRNSSGSSLRSTAYGTVSSRTSRVSVIRMTEIVRPSRGKLAGSTEVVSWPCRVMPASARASWTVAALVRRVRSWPSAMKVTVRSVRTVSVRPVRAIRAEGEAERYAPSTRTPKARRAPATVSAVVQTWRRTPSRVRVSGRP